MYLLPYTRVVIVDFPFCCSVVCVKKEISIAYSPKVHLKGGAHAIRYYVYVKDISPRHPL